MKKNKYFHTKQYGINDCGIACVSSILKYYNLNYNIDYLKDFTVEKQAYSLKDLISLFKVFDLFNCKAVQVESNNVNFFFSNTKVPTIALVNNEENQSHYIVVYEKTKDYYIVSDPAKNKIIKIPNQNFISMFTGVLLLVEKNEEEDQIPSFNSQPLNRTQFLKNIFLKNKFAILNILILSILVIIFTIGTSLFLKLIVDLILPMNLDYLLTYVSLGFLFITILGVIFDYFRNLIIIRLSYMLDNSIAYEFFNKITKLPISFFENREDGEIISRFNDTLHIRRIFSTTVISAVIDSTIIFGLSIVLYKINNVIFLTTLLPLILLACLTVAFFGVLEKRNKEVMKNKAITTAFLVQFIRNMTTIYSLNKKKYFFNSFTKKFDNQMRSGLQEMKAVNNSKTLKTLIQSSFSIIILWIGVQQVLNDFITLGTLLLINTFVLFLINSLDSLIGLQSEIQKALVAIDRTFNILEYPTSKETDTKFQGEIFNININNLTFGFDNFSNIFEEVNMNINRNEKILISGESGMGKSTFAKLMVKLYKVKDSMIFINGNCINKYHDESIRDHIIYLNENPFLFTGTIRENLCMGKDYSDEEIINACKTSNIFEFINKKEDGLNYLLNEHASNISTGQKQRISLARAILHKPEILILDESLSNVDESNSLQIHQNLVKLNVTIIFITHNPDFNVNYDQKFTFLNQSVHQFSKESVVF
jgi:ATP-binding cassette, subfamily C, bacteriocin exporter